MAQALRGDAFADVMMSAFTQMYGQLDPAVAEHLQARRKARRDALPGVGSSARPRTAGADHIHGEPDADAATHAVPVTARPAPRRRLPRLAAQLPSGALVESAPAVTHYPHLADPAWFAGRLVAFDEAVVR